MQTRQIVLTARPVGTPSQENFRTETITLPDVAEGEVLLKGLYYSVDPYMRGRMNDAKSYVPPFKLNEPLEGAVVAEVVSGKTEYFAKGDIVTGRLPWRAHMIASATGLTKVDVNEVPAHYYLGILGLTGLTAYFGLMYIGKPKPGETLVVSGAAGAVGMVVGQLGKMQGCRVIGIAGTDEKCKALIESYGFDEAINYKTTSDMKQAIKVACPNNVDIYFDNVGGAISDAVIGNINFHARIPLCGQISLYNSKEQPVGPRLQPMLLTRSVLMQGFIYSDYKDRFGEGIAKLKEWVLSGKLTSTETIEHGFDNLPAALLGLFTGKNTGKMVVQV